MEAKSEGTSIQITVPMNGISATGSSNASTVSLRTQIRQMSITETIRSAWIRARSNCSGGGAFSTCTDSVSRERISMNGAKRMFVNTENGPVRSHATRIGVKTTVAPFAR